MAGSLQGRRKLILGQGEKRTRGKKNNSNLTDKLQDRPDLEEVIKRGVAVAAEGIFIFQVLENQRPVYENYTIEPLTTTLKNTTKEKKT